MPNTTFLRGERVRLRPVESNDAAFLQRASNDPELRTPLGHTIPRNESRVADDIDSEDDESVRLLVSVDGDPIGLVQVESLSGARPFLSYWLVPESHGNGYATEAVGLFVGYVFDNFDKPALQAFTYEFNDASKNLLRKLGFEQEGRFRKNAFVSGEHVDTVHFGILREEWVGDE
ncbi:MULTISPECIES: GNAT family N-acetyltransferase [Halorussus]|uniref:GNAT family N-acetyltransferase n=1 Tax=Halorussus TaxID=1070314 RepID=UPI00209FFC1C|nr:GNAT family protein [Halorussus vallis]USZ75208.1 GNAT family N-acetyltransferase [Halorussus vallis]